MPLFPPSSQDTTTYRNEKGHDVPDSHGDDTDLNDNLQHESIQDEFIVPSVEVDSNIRQSENSLSASEEDNIPAIDEVTPISEDVSVPTPATTNSESTNIRPTGQIDLSGLLFGIRIMLCLTLQSKLILLVYILLGVMLFTPK